MKSDILIVDDSPVMRRFIQRVLDATGLEFGSRLEAGNGSEGLERMGREHIDIVLADMNMPVMDGAEMVRAMRRDPVLRKMPVLIVSTDRSEGRMEEMQSLGIDGYVTKPFSPERLEEEILAAFAAARQRTSADEPRSDPFPSPNPDTGNGVAAPASAGGTEAEAGEENEAGLPPGTPGAARPIARAVGEILETMCFLEVRPYAEDTGRDWLEDRDAAARVPPRISGEIGAQLQFEGCFAGTLQMYADVWAAQTIAANFLGEDEEAVLPEQMQYVMQELSNMICGSILHEKNHAGIFALSSPVPAGARSFLPENCEDRGPANTGASIECFRVANGWLAVSYWEHPRSAGAAKYGAAR